jgi:hypothetical protein
MNNNIEENDVDLMFIINDLDKRIEYFKLLIINSFKKIIKFKE